MPKMLDLTGQCFGRLTVKSLVASKPRRWLCQCDCGKTKTVRTEYLCNGHTRSCGCSWHEGTGKSSAGVARLYLRNKNKYESFRLRWKSLEAFATALVSLGERPEGACLRRKHTAAEDCWGPSNLYWGKHPQTFGFLREHRAFDFKRSVLSLDYPLMLLRRHSSRFHGGVGREVGRECSG